MDTVTQKEMQALYNLLRTPYKKGLVLWEEGVNIDCASVFRQGNEWRMIYARQDPRLRESEQGYETWMARSTDLLHWQPMGRLLSQRHTGWDGLQSDGGIALVDPTWEGTLTVEAFDKRYWMCYIGGALGGYEPDPLHIGIAHCTQLDTPCEWTRLNTPVLRMDDPEARPFERATLYKGTIIHDTAQLLGAPFVMFYNAKQPKNDIESIGTAVSDDMRSWRRLGTQPVIESGISQEEWSIAGDPQLIRINDIWVMNYFVAHTKLDKGAHAFDTFAASRDLRNWTRWNGPPLIEPSLPEDATFAHKPYIFCYKGTVYHFYCAVGSQGRALALATSAS